MDPQLQQRMMIYAGLIPGAVALVLPLAGWYFHAFRASRIDHAEGDTPRSAGDGPRWLLPLLLGLGFAGADYAANATLHLWPDGNNYRFTHAIALITLVAVIEGFFRLPLLLAMLLRLLAYAGAFWMLAEGYIDGVFGGPAPFVGWLLVAGIGAMLLATAADRADDPHYPPEADHAATPGWVDAITWIVIAAGMMPIFYFNNFAIGARMPAGIIAVLTSTLIVSLIFKDLRLSRGGITVLIGLPLTMLTGSFVQTGAAFPPSLVLVALAPCVVLLPMPASSPVRRLLARLILLVVILGSALATLQWSQAPHPGEDTTDDPYADYPTE
ncbi:MAG: hypothetical protein WD114_01170 [Phycisphaerales bacterium]